LGKWDFMHALGQGFNSNKTIENRNGIEDLSRTATEMMGLAWI
jgi:hypothetical protein